MLLRIAHRLRDVATMLSVTATLHRRAVTKVREGPRAGARGPARGDQPQVRGANPAVTVCPSTVAVTSPAASAAVRVLKATDVLLPAASSVVTRLPYADAVSTSTGASEKFSTVATSATFPA